MASRELKVALEDFVSKRAKELGIESNSGEADMLTTEILGKISTQVNMRVRAGSSLVSCESFKCPESFSCDWF